MPNQLRLDSLTLECTTFGEYRPHNKAGPESRSFKLEKERVFQQIYAVTDPEVSADGAGRRVKV